MKLNLPQLDERTCIGCGDCVDVCPTECLEMEDKLPWIPRPLDCVECAACVLICPVDAFTLARVENHQ